MTQELIELSDLIGRMKGEGGKWIVLVQFHGRTCSLCKFVWSQLNPMVERLDEGIRGRVELLQVDVIMNPRYAIHYKVKEIPTIMMVVVDNGELGETILYEKPISIPSIKERIIKELS